MVSLVEPSWLSDHLNDSAISIVDPRSPMKYLQGHVAGAVNLPIWKLFDAQSLELLPEEKLAKIIGEAGIDTNSLVVIYDAYDGQNAAMLAWVLEYLGHPDVRIMSLFLERWIGEGREILYKPVKPEPRNFDPKPNRSIRALWQDLLGTKAYKLLDVRSEEEFHGLIKTEARSGHLPGAINLAWTKLLGERNQFLRSKKELERTFSDLGLRPTDAVVTYCSNGPRAAIGYIALQQLGCRNVRLYDGSFHQWAQRPELPVEPGS